MAHGRNTYFAKTGEGELMEVPSPFRCYQRRYEERHPEKVKQWRLTSYIRALQREGYTVMKDGDTL